jgi:hypothetical protein
MAETVLADEREEHHQTGNKIYQDPCEQILHCRRWGSVTVKRGMAVRRKPIMNAYKNPSV